MVADVVGRVAVRRLPHDFAAIEIDRREQTVGRLDDRQALHVQAGGCGDCRLLDETGSRGWRGRASRFSRALCGARRVGGAAVTGSEDFPERLSADPETYRMSENPAGAPRAIA